MSRLEEHLNKPYPAPLCNLAAATVSRADR